MRLITIVVTIFILAMFMLNTNIFLKNVSLSTMYNNEKDKVKEIVEKRIIELKKGTVKNSVTDTVKMLNSIYFFNYQVSKNIVTVSVTKNKKVIYNITTSL